MIVNNPFLNGRVAGLHRPFWKRDSYPTGLSDVEIKLWEAGYDGHPLPRLEVGTLDDQPIFTTDIIYDIGFGLPVMVVSPRLALGHGHASHAKNGCWQLRIPPKKKVYTPTQLAGAYHRLYTSTDFD